VAAVPVPVAVAAVAVVAAHQDAVVLPAQEAVVLPAVEVHHQVVAVADHLPLQEVVATVPAEEALLL